MRSSILTIVFLMAIGCNEANGGGSKPTTPEMKISSPAEIEKANIKDDMRNWTYVEVNLDDMPFNEAFFIEHRAKGEGHTFLWRGVQYTTNLKDEYVLNDGQHNWVRNSDDMDDLCRSNEWDECGICNGKGPFTWYMDRDGDGLGDPETYVQDCDYPSVDEE